MDFVPNNGTKAERTGQPSETNIRITVSKQCCGMITPEAGWALFAHKVDGLVLDRFTAKRAPDAMAIVRLIGVQNFDKSLSVRLSAGDVEIEPDCEVPVEVDD